MFGIYHRMRFQCALWCPLVKDDVVLVGQPAAGSLEVHMQVTHHQVNRPTRDPTNKAAEGVLTNLER